MDAATEKSGPNPVLWVVFGILTFTVVASAFMVYAAHPAPAALVLRRTHATLPALDRTMELRPAVSAPGFTARTEPLPAGHWLVEVAGDDTWRLRGRFTAPAASLMELGR